MGGDLRTYGNIHLQKKRTVTIELGHTTKDSSFHKLQGLYATLLSHTLSYNIIC